MRGDAVQPAASDLWIAQRVSVTMGAQKRILRQVFGLGGVFHETKDVAIDSIVIRLEQHARVNGFDRRGHTAI